MAKSEPDPAHEDGSTNNGSHKAENGDSTDTEKKEDTVSDKRDEPENKCLYCSQRVIAPCWYCSDCYGVYLTSYRGAWTKHGLSFGRIRL